MGIEQPSGFQLPIRSGARVIASRGALQVRRAGLGVRQKVCPTSYMSCGSAGGLEHLARRSRGAKRFRANYWCATNDARYRDSRGDVASSGACGRSEEHTSELQSPCNLVCRLLLEKKKKMHREL